MVHYKLTLRGRGRSLQRLPGTYRIHGSRYFGVFGIVAALIFGGQALLHLLFALKGDPNYPFTIQDWIFGPIALLFLIWGINQFTIKGELTIDEHRVRCKYASLCGGDEWSEPLTSYHGVKKIVETDSTGGAFGHNCYTIRLVHPKSKKSFDVCSASTPDHLEADLDKYARLLGVERLN